MATEPLGQASTQLVYIPNFAELYRRGMLSQDWTPPRIGALMEALGEGHQVLEDIQFDVLMSTRLETAAGVMLDVYGRIVGEPRGVLSDDEYRAFIGARILANISKGSPDEIIAIFQIVTAPSRVRWLPMYPGGYKLQAFRSTWLSDRMRRRVRRIMEDVRPGGFATVLVEALVGHLTFAEGEDPLLGFDAGTFSRIL